MILADAFFQVQAGVKQFLLSIGEIYTTTWGYLRVNTNHQKTENRRLVIIEYVYKNKATIDHWIEVKASARNTMVKVSESLA